MDPRFPAPYRGCRPAVKQTGLSGLLWPIHLKPLDDELLSSWLMRLSRAYGLNPHTFCRMVWPDQSIWNRDLDHLASQLVIEILAQKTGVSIQRAWRTTLPAYEGVVFEKLTEKGRTSWLLPLGIWHRRHLRFGQQFCPACLATDYEPYFRRTWRLAFITCCVRHTRALLDRCPKCEAPVNFFYNKAGRENLALCSTCDFDLRRSPPDRVAPSVYEIRSQRSLQRVIERGWSPIGEYGPVYSHLYFDGMRVIARLLLSPRHRGSLKWVLGEEPTYVGAPNAMRHRTLEDHEIGTRRAVTLAAWVLTHEWPKGFARFCRENRIRGADVLRDFSSFPYWLQRGVRDELGLPTQPIAEREIVSSVSYLKKLGLPLTHRNVFQLLGRTAPPDAASRIRKALKSSQEHLH